MDWQELTRLTAGARFSVERVRLASTGVAIEGSFEPPALAQLTQADQVFVVAFVRCHGSIKEMERMFGVSYPTIKTRLNRLSQTLGAALQFETSGAEVAAMETVPRSFDRGAILGRLERGEITVREALSELSG